jgi:hypothetical protein
MRKLPVLVAASTVCACICVRAQTASPTPAAGEILLHPSQIKLSAHFEAPLSTAERATKAVGEQIDAKRAADAAHLQLSPIWDLAVWRYLPADPVRTLNSRVASDDDPFFTPEYLKLSTRQLDYQLKRADRASHDLLH